MTGEADLSRWFLVDGCDLSLAADEHGGSDIGSGLPDLVGEVGAILITRLGRGEVEGVGVAASAEGDVGPLSVGGSGDDTTFVTPAPLCSLPRMLTRRSSRPISGIFQFR